MSDTTPISNPPKRRGWLRKLVWIAGILVVLLVVVYFVATSSAFLKGVVLPKVSKALGADVTVAGTQISPFSHVSIRDLKVQPPAGETLLTLQEFHANYSLWSILGGNIVVSEVVIESPVVTVVQNADGTCNLDCLTKAPAKAAKPAPPAPAKAAKPPQIDIKKIALNNATVRLVKNYANGGKDVTEVTGLNFSITDLKNGQSGRIELAAALAVQKAAQTNAAAATLSAKLLGGFDLALTPDLKPGSVKGSTTFTVSQATGPLADLKAFAATFNCELTPTDLKELSLRFSKADALLARIAVSGPFDAAKSEGKLKLIISGIDRQALNLAGAASGMDFGTTTFDCNNDIELSNGGKLISLVGRFDLSRFQVKQKAQTSPTLDLQGDYIVKVDQSTSSVLLQTLNLTGMQDSRTFLMVGLSSPMTIGLGGSSSAVGDASLNLVVTNLNLADWKSLAGESAPGGVLNLVVKLVSQKAGQQLGFQADTHLDNLITGTGSAAVNQGNVHVQAGGSVADMKLVKLDNYQVDVVRQGKNLVGVSGSATFDSATQDADLQVALQTALAQLLAVPGASPTDGAVSFKGHVTSKQKKIGLTGELALTPTGRAKNILQLNGDVDTTQADAITGNIKVAAESLDVTRYYDLLSSLKPATNNAPVATSPKPAANPDQEPDAMKLPLKNFTFDLNIGHLFLREVDIASWQTTALIDGGHVVLKPCQLTLNGAPIKATTDLNLGVPGYTYDVAFNADAIPLAPLVDSFAPDRKGQIKGATSIGVAVKGAGVTGASLQKNLAGQFSFATTNMDLSIANVRSPLMSSVINVIIGIPDLIKNPTAALGNLLGGSTKKSGWADALTSSPIEAITMQANAGDGKVQLQSAEVRSAAFQTVASGQITLAPVLTNSTIQIPVQIALSRSLAGQIGLVDASTPANAVYVAMPDFLKMEGTIGQPQAKKDSVALLKLAAKAGAGIAGKIGGAGGEQAGALINSIGGLLGGSKTTTTNSAPAKTNASPVGGLLKLFK